MGRSGWICGQWWKGGNVWGTCMGGLLGGEWYWDQGAACRISEVVRMQCSWSSGFGILGEGAVLFIDLEKSFWEVPGWGSSVGLGGGWCAFRGIVSAMVVVCSGALTMVGVLDGGGDSFGVNVGLRWGVKTGSIALYERRWHCFLLWGILSTVDLVQVAAGGAELRRKLLGWKSGMKLESGVDVAVVVWGVWRSRALGLCVGWPVGS